MKYGVRAALTHGQPDFPSASAPPFGASAGAAPSSRQPSQPRPAAAPAAARRPRSSSSKALLLLIPIVLVGMCGIGAVGLYWFGAKTLNEATADGTEGTLADPAKLSEPREAQVNFVWFAGEPGPSAHGGTAKARIRVAPNPTGAVSVGVSEEFAGGGGNQWRTAVWLAAFNATRTLGTSLADYEFNVHVGGHTDGPSAGMLTTATMLALMRGSTPRADTTMTGTINPDGTAGPVGGIVQKMQGAKASGLHRFGFPIGARNHRDMQTGQDVDLLEVGASLGLEVKEISDLYEAYEFLTGDTLPRVEGLPEIEMEPSAQTQALLRAKITAWKNRVDRELGRLKQEVGRTGVPAQMSAPPIARAQKHYDAAQTDEKNSFLVAALDGYAQAALAIAIAIATHTTTGVADMFGNRLDDLIARVNTAQTIKGEVDALGQTLEANAGTRHSSRLRLRLRAIGSPTDAACIQIAPTATYVTTGGVRKY